LKVHFGFPDQQQGPVAATVGSFDGVHVAHQHLIRRLGETAARADVQALVVTFEPHPRCILDPANCPQSITTLAEKLDLLGGLGVDQTVVLEFTRELSQVSAEDFMARLRAAYELRVLLAGYDFALGRARQGNTTWLAEHGRSHGYAVEVVPPFRQEGRELHSSDVRGLLTTGDVRGASKLLGREYAISGLVEPGDRVGRTLGYPTVNIAVEANKLIPRRGVYAGRVRTPAGVYGGALSVGYRPTFEGTQLRVEAYLLDFSGDLYQQRLQVAFVERLRDEVRYPTKQALVEQMARDVEETRRVLAA
jgi:riboflavin kinase/FMN adenylyltransferase